MQNYLMIIIICSASFLNSFLSMKKLLIITLLLFFSFSVSAKPTVLQSQQQIPILWKLDTKPVSWLFGTIHLPDPRVNQLPLAAKLVFNQSDIVLTEIPMEFADTTLAQIKMKRTDGKTLSEVLPPDVRQRLDDYLKSANLQGTKRILQPLKTWAAYAIVSMLEVQVKHPFTKPLDANIYKMAKQKGKTVGGLETVLEQLGYFDQFTEAEQIEMLDESLRMLKRDKQQGKNSSEAMLQWYLSGAKTDMKNLMDELAPDDHNKALEEKFIKVLLLQRNELMAKRLAKKIKANPNKRFFVAIGAGHLSGEKNVPYFLEKLGIKSQRFVVPQ